MITSVFVSTDEIQFLTGKYDSGRNVINIMSVASEPLQSGAIINGNIANEGDIINCLERIKINNKGTIKSKVDIVIDTGSILVKKIKAPILSNKNMTELVKNEFLEVVNNYEDLIYDYSILTIDSKNNQADRGESEEEDKKPASKTGTIICSAIERSMIQSYVDVFKKSGFKIGSIDISLSPVLKLGEFLDQLIDKAYIMSIFDGNNMVSYLFSEKGYLLTNRTRLFSERNTEEFFEEVYRSLSSIIQFGQSHQSGISIGNIYLCGLEENTKPVAEYITGILNIHAGELKGDMAILTDNKSGNYNLSSMVYATGNIMRRGGA